MAEDEKILQQHLHLINNSFYGRTNIDTFKQNKKLLLTDLCAMCYKYFPIEFSSYEDYIKYLKEKGFALEVSERMYNNKEEQQ